MRRAPTLDESKAVIRAKNDLFWLAREVLGYTKLTKEFHQPIFREIDRMRRAGISRQMELWPRGHYKTTMRIAQSIQLTIINPDITILVVHAVEDEAKKIVQETGNHWQKNDRLRKLTDYMGLCPSKKAKRFLLADAFTVHRQSFNRQPTMMAKGISSAMEGIHVDVIMLDDIVARSTIEDSALPKIKYAYRSTLLPVLNPGGSILVTGTRWDIDDPYGERLETDGWHCRVRAALESPVYGCCDQCEEA